ncbi:uncharacterized protein [Parasteatoda tepidariorum]|uniref:uncharacterized protein n=1 Tax=Parasteatoda tepidariorum TaxID=114398 RepID=UPI0039BD38A6
MSYKISGIVNVLFLENVSFFRYLFVLACLGGFIYQCSEFLQIYWTYPTVIDIQDISPIDIDIPAITICNSVGYKYETICNYKNPKGISIGACTSASSNMVVNNIICQIQRTACLNGTTPPEDFQYIHYDTFRESLLTPDALDKLRVPLEDYLKCTIEFDKISQDCDLTYELGPFYSNTKMPQFCYSIYSLWGNPKKKRQTIKKGSDVGHSSSASPQSPQRLAEHLNRWFLSISSLFEHNGQFGSARMPMRQRWFARQSWPTTIIHLHFQINTTQRPTPAQMDENKSLLYQPKFNLPDSSSIQLAMHSPYFLPSPYTVGDNYIGGKAYDMRVILKEKHLLPAPYQTNCTDYTKTWIERDGQAPNNELGVFQECMMEMALDSRGCVPLNVDYPHKLNICEIYEENCSRNETSISFCLQVAESYTQPCDSISYSIIRGTEKDLKMTSYKNIVSRIFFFISIEHYLLKWRREFGRTSQYRCGTIDINLLFDSYEISNLTYKPRFESLEIFSVIGGYMGMWLGASFVAIFDLIEKSLKIIRKSFKRRQRRKSKPPRIIVPTGND